MKKSEKNLSDEEIIKHITGKNDPEYFTIIYDRYARVVYNKVLSFVKDEELAEDITHDIFVKVFLKLKSFRFTAKFSSWMYAITYNFCVDYVKRQKKEAIYLDEYLYEHAGDNSDSEQEIMNLQYQRLEDLLQQLQPEERMMLLLKYQDELSIKEMENVLDLKASAIKMRLKRAIDKILAMYKEKY